MSEENLTTDIQETNDTGIPVLPLRDVVVYPHMVIPLFVGRERSIVALDLAMSAGKRILLVAQKTADLDDPQPEDLRITSYNVCYTKLLRRIVASVPTS